MTQEQAYSRFVTLCRFFIDGYNPKPYNFPAVLDCILSIPPELVTTEEAGRYFAYDFCRAAVAAIENKEDPAKWMPDQKAVTDWLAGWAKDNTPAKVKDED